MKNLTTPTGLRIAGRFIPPGGAVPGDVPDFDYEKAARKGMIEDEDGDDIVNPATTTDPAADANASADSQDSAQLEEILRANQSLKQDLDTQRQEVQRLSKLVNDNGAQVTDLTKVRDDLQAQVTELQGELEAAQASAAKPEDAQALAEYREVVGELLPSDFPARKALFEGGYYTVKAVSAASDDDLNALDGIADKTLVKIREKAPAVGGE